LISISDRFINKNSSEWYSDGLLSVLIPYCKCTIDFEKQTG
jgi:hypothetical protein